MTRAETDMVEPDMVEEGLDATIEAARAGDQRAFERLYRSTVGPVYGLCLRLTANPALAEECVQQVYVQAWRNLSKFRGDSAIGTWLHRIAINEVRGQFRKEGRHEVNRVDAEDTPVTVDQPASLDQPASVDHPASVDLERAIAALPERARSVFVLVGIYGYPHEETANMLGIAIGTSKAHYHHARRRLRALLGDST